MTKVDKIDIDQVARYEFMKHMSLTELIDLVELHVKQQDNGCERIPVLLNEILDYYSDDIIQASIEIQENIRMYAYWNGGACQDLD